MLLLPRHNGPIWPNWWKLTQGALPRTIVGMSCGRLADFCVEHVARLLAMAGPDAYLNDSRLAQPVTSRPDREASRSRCCSVRAKQVSQVCRQAGGAG